MLLGVTCQASCLGAFNFQEPSLWKVGDAGTTFRQWEATPSTPFQAVDSPPTERLANPMIDAVPELSVHSPGFVASSGGYYAFSDSYRITADIYNHGGTLGMSGGYAAEYGTRVLVQTAATTNPDFDASVFQDSMELVHLDGTPISGGANEDLLGVTQLFLQEVETPFGPANQQELIFEFLLPQYSADFRVQFESAVHSSFQQLRVDTFLVEKSSSADFDGDGDVDSEDLAIWQTASRDSRQGDADGDHDSDGSDFLNWQRSISPSIPVSVVQVPEPISLLLVLASASICLNLRILRSRNL